MTEKIQVEAVDFVSIPEGSYEIIRPWAVFVLLACLLLCLCAVIAVCKQRNQINVEASPTQKFVRRISLSISDSSPFIVRYVVALPLVAISILQYVNPIRAITFTMSGDARNVFLLVMRTRIDASFPSFRDMAMSGRFGETLATGISISNGTQGFPQIADQYAVRSVCVLLMCVILGSIAVLFTNGCQTLRGVQVFLRGLLVIGLSVFVMLSPYPFAEIFRSGFFSLFAALGFLAAAVAFLIPQASRRGDVILFASISVFATQVSYQLIALVLIPSLVVAIGIFLWTNFPTKGQRVGLLTMISAVAAICITNLSYFVDRFHERVIGGGAVRPTTITFVVFLFAICTGIFIVAKGTFKRLLISVSVLSGSALVVLQLVNWSRGEEYLPHGYYGYKLMYGANFLGLLLLVALVGVLISNVVPNTGSNKMSLFRMRFVVGIKSLGAVVATTLIVIATFHFSVQESPAVTINRGWQSPSESIVDKTIELWEAGETNYIFSSYGNDSNDRIANFWSPFFWEANRWEWTYVGYDVSPFGLCGIIGGKRALLVTASPDLARQIRGMCPLSVPGLSDTD